MFSSHLCQRDSHLECAYGVHVGGDDWDALHRAARVEKLEVAVEVDLDLFKIKLKIVRKESVFSLDDTILRRPCS